MTAEKEIENQFIHILSEAENQWRYREDIRTESALWQNLRKHLNRINQAQRAGTPLTDVEFERIKVEFGRLTATPFQASQWLRGENGVAQISLEREDTSKIVIEFFRNKDVAGGISSYEVVNQIVPATDKVTRGDVTLLINGLPIIHVELKNESAKDGYMQAYRQIERYALDGFLMVSMRQHRFLLFQIKYKQSILLDQVEIQSKHTDVWKNFCLTGGRQRMWQ